MLLLALTLGILAGTALGLAMLPPYPGWPAASLALGLLAASLAMCWRTRWLRLVTLFILAAVLSGARAQLELVRLDAAALPGDVGGVRGIVMEAPRQVGRAATFIVQVDSVQRTGDWQPWAARIEARTFGFAPAEGDRVDVTGTPRAVVDLPGLPRATTLRRRHVTQEVEVERLRVLQAASSTVPGWRPEALRQWMEERISEYLAPPYGGLAAGLLLGSRAGITPDVRAQFAQTGTSHIVAVSGFNVVIVSSFVSLIAVRFIGVRWGAIVVLIAIAGYTLLVGAPPSAVRAAIMGGGAFMARLVLRPSDSLGGLTSAGALMSLFDPMVVQDLGFQLSMLATAGLILLLSPTQSGNRWVRLGMGLVATPLAAQVATLPLTLHVFHSLSLVAVVANALIAFLLPFAMALGAVLIVVADIQPLAEVIAFGAWLATSLILETVRWCASLPSSSISTGSFPLWAVLSCYLALIAWVAQRSPELAADTRIRSGLRIALPLMLAATILGLFVQFRPTSELAGDLLEQGEVMIAQTPSGRTVVLGTSLSPPALLGAIADRLPTWKRNVEVVIVNEDSAASWRGLAEIAERYAIDILLVPPGGDPPVIRAGQLVVAEPGTRIIFGDDTEIVVPTEHRSASGVRDYPVGLTFGSAGLRFPAVAGQWTEGAGGRAWLTVSRHQPATPRNSTLPAGPVVRMAPLGAEVTRGAQSDGVSISPKAGRLIGFSTDGEQLTMQWNGCHGQATACVATVSASAQ